MTQLHDLTRDSVSSTAASDPTPVHGTARWRQLQGAVAAARGLRKPSRATMCASLVSADGYLARSAWVHNGTFF